MNIYTKFLFVALFTGALTMGYAQTTAINYQGSLSDGSGPAEGAFEFEFEVFDALTDGVSSSGPLTVSSVSVSAGLFSTELDFGGAAFDGSDRWLEIRVRPQSSTDAYVTLSPRQSITSAPYAIRSLSAEQAFTATSAASAITATTAASVAVGGVDAGALQEGSVGTASVANDSLQPEDLNVGSFDLIFWKLGGNSGVTPGVHFLGTRDDQPLEFKVNSEHALRLEGTAGTPNLVGGFSGNTSGVNTEGVTIGGGGGIDAANMVSDESDYVVIAGGLKNSSQSGARATTIGGGEGNRTFGQHGTIAGGLNNYNSGLGSTVGGGNANVVAPNDTVVSGGVFNRVLGNSLQSTIGGGGLNTIESGSRYSTIGGGRDNHVFSGSVLGTIGGGERNVVGSGAPRASIGAGFINLIHDLAVGSRIGGGFMNTISTNSFYSTISGGTGNLIETNVFGAFIGGGQTNVVGSTGQFAVVSGGNENLARGAWSAIPGGELNRTTGDYAFAAGRRAHALNQGSFVWADSTDEDFTSTGDDQFLIRASGGVAIGTNDSAGAALRVVGDVKANRFIGMGETLFLGTSDNEPVELFVNGERAMRFEYPGTGTTPNVIGGANVNYAESDVTGATIGGGGGRVFGTWTTNAIRGDFGTVGGGAGNFIELDARYATIGGGYDNTLGNLAHSSTIGGGERNLTGFLTTGSTIGGGTANTIWGQSKNATIAGGATNIIYAFSPFSTIGGGWENGIAESMEGSTISGGRRNWIASPYAAIGGGSSNTIGVLSFFGTIPGGYSNEVHKSFGFAAGRQAKAKHLGTFVWSDSTDADFASTANNQFLIRASGGVGIGTTSPDVPLHVSGGTDTSVGGGGYLVTGNLTGENISMDNNEITARFNGGSDTLFLNADSGPVAIGSTSSATDYKVRVNGGANGGAYILGAASGLAPAVLRVQSSTGDGVALHATQTSADATAVFSNKGTGDLIRGFGSAGPLVFSVSNGGSVNATAFNNTSDRNAKENFSPVDPLSILKKVVSLPVSRWNFRVDSDTPHIGPMAQDFHGAFGVGPDDKHIATVDADGVALAAIQGLNSILEEKESRIEELERRLEALEKRMVSR